MRTLIIESESRVVKKSRGETCRTAEADSYFRRCGILP